MFGLDKLVSSVINDPVGTVIRSTVSPVVNTINIVDGLSEGEIRSKAIMSLGADVAAGMAAEELIEWYQSS